MDPFRIADYPAAGDDAAGKSYCDVGAHLATGVALHTGPKPERHADINSNGIAHAGAHSQPDGYALDDTLSDAVDDAIRYATRHASAHVCADARADCIARPHADGVALAHSDAAAHRDAIAHDVPAQRSHAAGGRHAASPYSSDECSHA